ncbi:MAG: phospholipase [Rubrivivax sp.]|nr:phospholipase [Rubrivivax sp.]
MDTRNDLLIQRPEAAATRQRLLLFHGVGSGAEDLRPLGEALAAQRPRACVVSVRSPDPSDLGQGWQWFSVRGVTEADRPARVAAAMPRFVEAARAWQRETAMDPGSTTLIGFSRGAIMALESTQQPGPVAGRGSASPDLFTGLGHGIDARVVRRVVEHL